MHVLLAGGAGYIGSDNVAALSQAGHEVVLLDGFYDGNPSILEQHINMCGVGGNIRELCESTVSGCLTP